MIIDIDIKIADCDGTLLHRLEKRFDDLDLPVEKLNYDTAIGKNFEDFLSEYMSSSGRTIREKLIQNYNTTFEQSNSDSKIEMHGSAKENVLDRFKTSHMEYNIRIGNKNLFTGIISLNHPSFLPAIKNTPLKDEKESVLYENEDSQQTDYKIPSANRKELPSDQEEADIDTMIDFVDFTMMKAIEKYEVNLYQVYEEERLA
jgi:hypothetical protein